MAYLAVHRKEARDEKFLPFFDAIEEHATDERNFVRKAVNWALRQIGKRNLHLQQIAVETANRLRQSENKTARWIGSDALRELTDATHLEAIRKKDEGQKLAALKKAKLKL